MRTTVPDSAAARVTAPRSVVRRAVVGFLVLWALTVALVSIGSTVWVDHVARDRALRSAMAEGSALATRLAGPLVDRQVREGPGEGRTQLTEALLNRMADGSVRHLRLWSEDGTVLWSDEPELVGRHYDLAVEVRDLFGEKDAFASVADLSGAEHATVSDEGQLIEVYAGTLDRDGAPLVVEAYLSGESIVEEQNALRAAFLPVILASLGVLTVMFLPLAVSLARRVQLAQADRAALMRHALLASDLERRRVADDLHHTVVQELAGLGYSLPAITRDLRPGQDPEPAVRALERATDVVQRNVVALRSLMSELYPPDLRGPGLSDAVQQLVRTEAFNAGLEARVDVSPAIDVPDDVGRLAYRVVREGVRNVVKHAGAQEVVVSVVPDGPHLVVEVVDDGVGPGRGASATGAGVPGHFGLRLLVDTVRDVGGRLDLAAVPSGGSVLRADLPLVPPEP